MGKYCDCEPARISPDGQWREGDCRLCWLDKQTFEKIGKTLKERLEKPVNVDDTTYKNRLSICNKCEHRNANWTCKLCSCHLNTKAKWITEKCPDNRWPLITIEVKNGDCNCGQNKS